MMLLQVTLCGFGVYIEWSPWGFPDDVALVGACKAQHTLIGWVGYLEVGVYRP